MTKVNFSFFLFPLLTFIFCQLFVLLAEEKKDDSQEA